MRGSVTDWDGTNTAEWWWWLGGSRGCGRGEGEAGRRGKRRAEGKHKTYTHDTHALLATRTLVHTHYPTLTRRRRRPSAARRRRERWRRRGATLRDADIGRAVHWGKRAVPPEHSRWAFEDGEGQMGNDQSCR